MHGAGIPELNRKLVSDQLTVILLRAVNHVESAKSLSNDAMPPLLLSAHLFLGCKISYDHTILRISNEPFKDGFSTITLFHIMGCVFSQGYFTSFSQKKMFGYALVSSVQAVTVGIGELLR